jgi:hypothetical protein
MAKELPFSLINQNRVALTRKDARSLLSRSDADATLALTALDIGGTRRI